MSSRPSLTCIMPVQNEAGLLPSALAHALSLDADMQIIVADGASTDGSLEIARRFEPRVVTCSAEGGRHEQLNCALKSATGDIVFCLAVDVRLQPTALLALRFAVQAGYVHGCLFQRSASSNWVFRIQDFFARMRARCCASAYMDQVPFYLRSQLLELDGFRACRSYDTADAHRRIGKPQAFICIARSVLSSCRSWQQRGFLRQFVQHQRQRVAYLSGTILRGQS